MTKLAMKIAEKGQIESEKMGVNVAAPNMVSNLSNECASFAPHTSEICRKKKRHGNSVPLYKYFVEKVSLSGFPLTFYELSQFAVKPSYLSSNCS